MDRRVLLMLTLFSLGACSSKESRVATPGVATPAGVAAAVDAPRGTEVGERIYNGNCVPCHQQTGQGIPGVYPSLAASPVVLGDPTALALWVVKGQRPASMPAGRYSTVMLQFGWMKPADAAALLSYVRSHFGNSAPPVDAAAIAAALAP